MKRLHIRAPALLKAKYIQQDINKYFYNIKSSNNFDFFQEQREGKILNS